VGTLPIFLETASLSDPISKSLHQEAISGGKKQGEQEVVGLRMPLLTWAPWLWDVGGDTVTQILEVRGVI